MSFFKNLHFVAVAYIIKRQQSLNQNIFYLIQRVLDIVN